MSATVCLAVTGTLGYPQGGGHYWVFLNWALGLRELGHRVIWLETVPSRSTAQKPGAPKATEAELRLMVDDLASRLARYGLHEIALARHGDLPCPRGCLRVDEAAAEADLLLNFQDKLTSAEIDPFPRAAFIDIDPGLRQLWISGGEAMLARHDAYFTIGETVGAPGARFPDCGIRWRYTPPAVFLPAWPVTHADGVASYTTVAHWYHQAELIEGQKVDNDKRAAFLDYIDVPPRAPRRLELALCVGAPFDEERAFWGGHGWSVTDAWEVTGTPWDYQRFIRYSRGEFSCAKATCRLLENAWISDRTLCYLASGKPAIVEYTGPSRLLPEAEGLLRFRTPDEAVARLREAESRYEHHSRAARQLAEEHFDATKVVSDVLERAFT